MTAIVTLGAVALDCPDPHALAAFYQQLCGWPLRDDPDPDADWVELVGPAGFALAFQQAERYVAPTWPEGAVPQQAHLDFDVADLDAGEAQVLALGARKAEVQPGTTFRVFIDPVGHPFCLCQG